MQSRELIGKWRYALTKKLKKRIRKVASLRMCLKIDPECEQGLINSYCGTSNVNEDCPFFLKRLKPETCDICLAPTNDPLWFEEKKRQGSFISSRYEKTHQVVGCYLIIFSEIGYENYKRLKRWEARLRAWQLAQSKTKLGASSII